MTFSIEPYQKIELCIEFCKQRRIQTKSLLLTTLDIRYCIYHCILIVGCELYNLWGERKLMISLAQEEQIDGKLIGKRLNLRVVNLLKQMFMMKIWMTKNQLLTCQLMFVSGNSGKTIPKGSAFIILL